MKKEWNWEWNDFDILTKVIISETKDEYRTKDISYERRNNDTERTDQTNR
jgi:hypothetical protein